jgi:Family of unknown function (DUF695)
MRAARYAIITWVALMSVYAQEMKTREKEPKGLVGRSYEDGMPVIWRFVNEPPTIQKRKALPWLTIISWKYDGSRNNGMPPKRVNNRMLVLEQTIEREVEKTNFCEHAISRTGSNLKELIYYIHDRDAFMDRLNVVLASQERYPIEITFFEDRDWKEHEHARELFSKCEPDTAASRSQPSGPRTNQQSAGAGFGH